MIAELDSYNNANWNEGLPQELAKQEGIPFRYVANPIIGDWAGERPEDMENVQKQRLKGLNSIGNVLGAVGDFAASFVWPNVILETVTGRRGTSTTGEKVSLAERTINVATAGTGGGAVVWFLRKGANVVRAYNKYDNVVSGIVKKYEKFQCVDAAKAVVKALNKAKVEHKIWKIEANHPQATLGLSLDYPDIPVSQTNVHYGVEIDGIVYDNIFKDGIPLDEWLKAIEAARPYKVLSPKTVTAKEIK